MGGLGLGVLGPFLGPFGESGPGALQEPEGPSWGPSGPMGGWEDAGVKALRDNLFLSLCSHMAAWMHKVNLD